eukprot:187357-Pyramimonas_sp.AAC.1
MARGSACGVAQWPVRAHGEQGEQAGEQRDATTMVARGGRRRTCWALARPMNLCPWCPHSSHARALRPRPSPPASRLSLSSGLLLSCAYL